MNDDSGKNLRPQGQGPRRLRTLILVAALGALLIALAVYLIGRFAGAPGPEVPGGAARLALGKLVYDARCAACHGVNLEAQ